MEYIVLNIAPILVATLAGLGLSALYHALLGRRLDRGERRDWAVVAPLVALLQFWLCCILAGAVILAPTDQGAGPWTMLGSAIIIWIVGPALLASYRYRGLAWSAAWQDALAWLAIMLTQAAVLQGIGVSAP